MRRLLSALLLGVLLVATTAAQAVEGGTIIYLMRHGENIPTDPSTVPYNPHLSEAGKARAQELAKILRSAPITGIFSTNLHRTLQTAAPLAAMKNLQVEIYDPDKADAFVQELRSKPGVYVVSGHSDTTPEMVRRLGGKATPIEHWEHDRLYILVYQQGSDEPATILLRYGEVSEPH